MSDVLIGLARWMNETPGWLPLLVDAVLKATAMLAATGVATLMLRRASAATRHALWAMAMIGSLALPLLLTVVPRWPVAVLPVESQSALWRPASPAVALPASDVDGAPRPAAAPASIPGPGVPQPTVRQAIPLLMPKASTLLLAWAAVALGLVGRLAAGHVRVRRLARGAPVDVPWIEIARNAATRIGLRKLPVFVEGAPDAMPMTWGILRQVVMVPSAARSWSDARLRAVLLHELAHVRRRDCLTQAVAGLVCAIYWFNPLTWLAAARLRAERERACDDSVLAAGANGPDYAEQLLDIARALRPVRLLSPATVSMARRSQLEGRLLAILDPAVARTPPRRTAIALCTLALAIAVPLFAAIVPSVSVARDDGAADSHDASSRSQDDAPNAPALPGWVAVQDVAAEDAPAGEQSPSPAPTPTPTPMPTPSTGTTIERGAGEPAGSRSQGDSGATARRANGGAEYRRSSGEDARAEPVDQKVIDALSGALKDEDKQVREHALLSLGRLRDKRALEPLIAALSDESPGIREQAAFALGQLREPAVVDPLVRVLRDGNADVREQAAFALGQTRDVRAVEPLTGALADTDADVREQAAFALGQLGDPRASQKLIATLKDVNADVREQAAFALSQLKDPAAAGALGALLGDVNPDVREQAVFALGQIRDAGSVEPLIGALADSSAEVQAHAAFALGQQGDRRAVAPLIKALSSRNAEVREHAAFALGQLGDPKATDALLAALKDSSADVRQAAALALSQVVGRPK